MKIRSIITGLALLPALLSQAHAQCKELTVGSAISLTGKYATDGTHSKNGYDYAVEKIREAGGVRIGGQCYNFRVIYYDDESKGDRGATLAERLINQDKVQYMLGPYSSGMVKAIAPVTEKYRIPMVEAEGASRSLFNKGYKYLFAVLSTSEQYLASAITLAAEKARETGKQPSSVKVAIAVENDPFSLDIRAGVLEDAAKFGMKVVVDEKLPRDLSDMSAILTKVKVHRPDVLIVSGHSKGAATAVRQIGEQKINTPMIALTHCEVADVVGKFGDAANGILCSTQWAETLSYSDPIFGSASEYERGFKKAYPDYANKSVPYQTAQASAAVYVLKDAFERANSLDKEKLRDAIAETDLSTFYGQIRFSENGNNIAKPMVMRQIQNGKYNVVAPSEFASHKLDWPRTPR
ncbi:MAG: amino acid ABC transporter substrate-binding protein [Gammaproteobacteria bacterium]|nr:amino acid ABC transporter substrate-binding protein [Gammaproteobacteria bacterium]CAJ2377390.1 MAG: Amino acid ABC transporter substrate-binding protein [Arenicellales bacterium IbO2]MDA7962400.1 amino acid ABC transporter substrate-binding protein [Gammaproteobacteria bacterium]MDA7968869.1 amino acid ABC transporter substrate-binding protein [Gammaproteobacteria bacterium]MDA7969999.1 amino acid ABC transporter substrate-binding protein [Gammaproteobacteria bacterium]